MAYATVSGKQLTDKENQEYQEQQTTAPSQEQAWRTHQLEEHEQARERAEALALKLAQTYEELTRLLERNPAVKRQITEGEAKEDKVFRDALNTVFKNVCYSSHFVLQDNGHLNYTFRLAGCLLL